MTRWMKGIEFPWLMTLGLVLAGMLLVACGKERPTEPRESRLGLTPVASVVDPGSGRSLRVENLKVRTSAGTSRVSRDGRVSTMIFEAGPQYAELFDNRGRTVMLAFVSPAEPDFSALSTARAVGYLALAGPWLRAEGRLKLLDEVDTVAGFLPLLAAVKSQLADRGYLDLEDEQIQSALATMITAIHGPGPELAQIVRPLGVIATPTTASGLSLDTTGDNVLAIENRYLRRVSLFFRRLSHVPAAGAEVQESNGFTRIDMENVVRYGGITGTIDSYLKGDVPYWPVTTDPPLNIPRFPADAKSTTYQIFAIGAGGSSQAGLVVPEDIVAEQQILQMKTLFLDVFMVLIANTVLPLAGEKIDDYLKFVGANAIITDVISTLKNTIPDAAAKVEEGDWPGAALAMITAAYTSNTILPALGQLTLNYLWSSTDFSSAEIDEVFEGMSGVLDKMGKLDVGLTLADTALLGRDIVVSKRIEQFLVTTTPGKVVLAAANNNIRPEETTTIEAVMQRPPGSEYEYRWSVSPNSNYWVEDGSLKGTDDSPDGVLVTRESRVNIRSLVTTDGQATVRCEVVRLDGGRQPFGEGETTITFKSDLLPYEVPSTLITKATSSVTVLDGSGRPRLESAFVSTLVIFNVAPGTNYRLLENGIDHGYRLMASDIARGAPVFSQDTNYGSGPWPAPYRGDWYNLGNGKAAFSYGSWTTLGNLGVYHHDGDPTLAQAIATEIARQQALIGALHPKVFVVP